VLVVDLTKNDGAYRSWFDNVQPLSKKTVLDNHYLVALHISVVNPEAKQSTYFDFHSHAGTTWQYKSVKPSADSPVEDIKMFWLDQPKTVDGWHLMAVEKSIIEKELQETGTAPIILTRVNRVKGQSESFNFIPY
ncbi:hypothetical protein, partial [Paenibacillus sp. y28]|uniref:hypothetical protein n=1 Tax=Paenibacillus sp. y28 TaxID=3129110 RepID=UPI003019138C